MKKGSMNNMLAAVFLAHFTTLWRTWPGNSMLVSNGGHSVVVSSTIQKQRSHQHFVEFYWQKVLYTNGSVHACSYFNCVCFCTGR